MEPADYGYCLKIKIKSVAPGAHDLWVVCFEDDSLREAWVKSLHAVSFLFRLLTQNYWKNLTPQEVLVNLIKMLQPRSISLQLFSPKILSPKKRLEEARVAAAVALVRVMSLRCCPIGALAQWPAEEEPRQNN